MEDIPFDLKQLGSTSISSEAPCGIPARYEPEYELLQAEIDKLASIDSKPVDWDKVVRLSLSILREKSKDLLVAGYLARGLFEQSAYAGLEIALTTYRDLVREHWDHLFPELKRMQGRINAITWMIERLGQAIARRETAASENESIQRCQELAEEISSLLAEKLGDKSPNSSVLIRLLKESRGRSDGQASSQEQAKAQAEKQRDQEEKEEQEIQEKKEEPQPLAPQSVPSPPSSAPTALATENDANRALRDCQRIVREVAAFLRNQNLAAPLSYRILRVGTWMLVKELPESKNLVTEPQEVRKGRVKRYEQLLKAGEYLPLISEVEGYFPTVPFWLDAHRFTTTALAALGPSYAEARGTVMDELAHFIHRLPGVVDRKFVDGTPLADDQTRLWIEDEVMELYREKSQENIVTPEGNAMKQQPWMQVAKEARELAMKGKFLEGVILFQDGQKRSSSERDRFLWRFHQAQFCFDAGYLDLAIPQLEFLNEHVEHLSLEEWEPCLSIGVAQLLLQAYYRLKEKTGKADAKIADKIEHLYALLCRLDLTAALTIAQGSR